MKITVSNINDVLTQAFSMRFKEHSDNCGFLAGRGSREVTTVLISLDISEAVVAEARNAGAELIVAHHPLFFANTIQSITDKDPKGRTLLALFEAGIAAICMHTNADSADGGVNDLLALKLGLSGIILLGGGDTGGLGRIGCLEKPLAFPEFAGFVKRALHANGLRVVNAGRAVSRVAVGGGACGDFVELAAEKGADTYVTADVKYHQFQLARDLGLNLIDAGHFATENLICEKFRQILRESFPGLMLLMSDANRELPVFFT